MSVNKQWLSNCISEIDQSGYVAIPDFLTTAQLTALQAGLDSQLGRYTGRNNFEGLATERIYTLVGRGKPFEDLVEDPRVLALCAHYLAANFLLSASQAIRIHPGESPQPFHADDSFYPIPRPRPMVSLSTIFAIDDFTLDNGATQFIPQSHLWDDETFEGQYSQGFGQLDTAIEERMAEKTVTLQVPAGACIIFAGNLLHRGGANISSASRCAISNQYCQPWARTQENFFLGVPVEKARTMSATNQALLGYSIHPPFMGQLSASHPLKALEPGFVAPILR